MFEETSYPTPHDVAAERHVISCMLQDCQVIDEVRRLCSATDFYDSRHQVIVSAIYDLANAQHGQGVDLITLSDELNRREQLDEIGGQGFLGQMASVNLLPTHAGHHARIIRLKAIQRRVQQVAQTIFREACNPQDPDRLLEFCESQVLRIADSYEATDLCSLKEALHLLLDRSDRLQRGEINRRYTGFAELDSIARLANGQLVIIAARTSVGKSLLGIQLARQINTHSSVKLPSLIASLEMRREEIAARLVSAFGNVPTDVASVERVLNLPEVERLMQGVRHLENEQIFIIDSGMQTVSSIASHARRLKRRHGLGMLMVDYLQLIQCEVNRSRSRAEALGEVSGSLKRLAQELDCPVIALCQLNRETDDTEEPQLRHIRESGSIEQDADMVWMLWRAAQDVYDPNLDQMIYLKVAKNRQGPTGTIQLLHRKEYMRFEPSLV
jgi:replicative DNA helicase